MTIAAIELIKVKTENLKFRTDLRNRVMMVVQ